MSTSPQTGDADIPKGLIDAVASLVATGPVPLGGYTLAEIDAVSGIVQFLEHDHPWRFVLMPQPEDVTLEILIDAPGIHFHSLRRRQEALDRLWERLPFGDRGPDDADANAVLAASPKSVLIATQQTAAV